MTTAAMMPTTQSPAEAVYSAQIALAAANTDFERLAIRDQAKAAQEAAKILGLRDIQVSASEIVARAERAVVKANPPVPPAQRNPTGAQQPTTPPPPPVANDVAPAVLRKMRQAHAMADNKFEAIIKRARETQQPLTRNVLVRESAPDTAPRPSARPPATPSAQAVTETLRERIAELMLEKASETQRANDAEEISEFLRQQGYPDAASREQLLNNQRAEIRTLTSQVQEWQTKFEDQRRETVALRRELKKLEAAA